MIDLALNDNIYIYDELDEAIQELDILLNTENSELIGNINFGANIYPYLWTLTPAVDSLKKYLYDLIEKHTFYVKNFHYTINVDYYNENYKSTYLVQIILQYGDKTKTVNYKF